MSYKAIFGGKITLLPLNSLQDRTDQRFETFFPLAQGYLQKDIIKEVRLLQDI